MMTARKRRWIAVTLGTGLGLLLIMFSVLIYAGIYLLVRQRSVVVGRPA